LYRYDSMTVGPLHIPVRIHRVTGRTEGLYPSGWAEIAARPESRRQISEDLTADELGKLTGTAKITNSGWIEAQIYNGTEKAVREVTVGVSIRNKDGTIAVDRRYALTSSMGRRLSSSEYIAKLGFQLEPGQKLEWSIVSAKGQ
jgi:hypothetical protein